MSDRLTILDKVEEAFQIAEKRYGRTFTRPKKVHFREIGKSVGGYSWNAREEMMFHLGYYNQCPENYLNQIVPHEVAHWVDVELNGYQYTTTRYGRRRSISHGATWKYIMRFVYGLNPDRCLDPDAYQPEELSARKREKFSFSCNCPGKVHKVTSVINNKILLHGKRYTCRSCKGIIVPLKENVDTQVSRLMEQISKLTNSLSPLK